MERHFLEHAGFSASLGCQGKHPLSPRTRYVIPARLYRVEESIQRSRFITTLAPASSVAEAQAFIQGVREAFPDATHHCWAYLVGQPESSDRVGVSDDGEPHGTAGRPMLKVLSHSGVGDVAAVVTRYYGGVKLGKGGLVRAYSGGVKLALDSLPTLEKVAYRRLGVIFDYSYTNPILKLLEQRQAKRLGEDYAADVSLQVDLPADQLDAFIKDAYRVTNGQALIEQL